MKQQDSRAFEGALRTLIEDGQLHTAEALVRDAAAAAGEASLLRALDRPLESVVIEDWASIGADMEDARRFLPPEQRGLDWQALFVGLVNDSSAESLHARIRFGLNAELPSLSAPSKPAGMTEAEAAAHSRALRLHMLVRNTPLYGSGSDSPGLRIAGLEDLCAVERASADADENAEERERRWHRDALAAAIILLRFHQAVERYAGERGVPRPMTLVAHVVRTSWPMEAGIVEFGTEATRLLECTADRFDHAAAARILAHRVEERHAAYLEDTRRIVWELREKEEALALWPWRQEPKRRRGYARFVNLQRAVTRRALKDMHGVRAGWLSGERLYRAFAAARHPDDPHLGLAPPAPEDRTDLHRLAMAYAKRFGGETLRDRFPDYPDVPTGLFERIAGG